MYQTESFCVRPSDFGFKSQNHDLNPVYQTASICNNFLNIQSQCGGTSKNISTIHANEIGLHLDQGSSLDLGATAYKNKIHKECSKKSLLQINLIVSCTSRNIIGSYM